MDGPSQRAPYRAAGTPPPKTLRLAETPTGVLLSKKTDDYPESPSRSTYRRRPSDGDHKPHSTSPEDSKKKIRVPRALRTPKRAITALILLGFLGFLARRIYLRRRDQSTSFFFGGNGNGNDKGEEIGAGGEAEYEEGKCTFVSTVEAYQRDLKRLRTLVASKSNITLIPQDSAIRDPPKSRHLFSSTGHLLVSDLPDNPHPIPLLLQRGEKHWEQLLAKQSTTLGEAVIEYTRRYGRRPPLGFDIWWDLAMGSELVLPDEYDRINMDLAPFFALPKQEVLKRIKDVEDMPETFTLIIKDGQVDIQIKDPGGLEWEGTWPRAEDAASMVQSFAHMLPDMNATFSIFDQPQIYLSWARRASLVDLGLRNLHTTHLQESDVGHVNLARSCSPDSNYRTNPNFEEGRSFIYDNNEAADMCQNPYVVPLHGLFIEPHEKTSHPRPHTQLLPLFSLAKTSINSDILITPLDQFFDPPGDDPKWEDKSSSKLAWRGSPTGISMMSQDLPWRSAHRIRLHHFANNKSMETVSTYMTPQLGQSEKDDDPDVTKPLPIKELEVDFEESLGHGKEDVMTRIAHHFFFDVKLAGKPLQCDEKDGTCRAMEKEIKWAPYQPAETLNRHKFLLDIDGNGWSGRFKRLMSTNSVVIKTGLFTEWFQPHLIPWFMYIPSKLDFSDLADILAFFRGTPKHPDLGFDETAKAIARNGKCFVERMFRLEDLQAYMLRLFLEYARLAAPEGVDMDFYHDEDAFASKHRMKDDTSSSEDSTGAVKPVDVANRKQQAQSAFKAKQKSATDTAISDSEETHRPGPGGNGIPNKDRLTGRVQKKQP